MSSRCHEQHWSSTLKTIALLHTRQTRAHGIMLPSRAGRASMSPDKKDSFRTHLSYREINQSPYDIDRFFSSQDIMPFFKITDSTDKDRPYP